MSRRKRNRAFSEGLSRRSSGAGARNVDGFGKPLSTSQPSQPPERNGAGAVTKVSSLEPGQGLVGPEPGAGCFNTGLAPTIARSKVKPSLYVVGTENAVSEVLRAIRYGVPPEKFSLPQFARVYANAEQAFVAYRKLKANTLEELEEQRKRISALKLQTSTAVPYSDEWFQGIFGLEDEGALGWF